MSYTLALASFYTWRDWGKEKNSVMSGSTTLDKVPERSLLKHVEVGWEGGPGEFTPSPNCSFSLTFFSAWATHPPLPSDSVLLLFTLHSHLLWHKEVCFSLLGLLFFPATPLLEKTLISWQLGNAVDPRKRDLSCGGSLEESGSSKFPGQLHKTQSSQAGPPGECDPKGDSKKKGKTEGREPLSIPHEAPVRPSGTPREQFASVPQNLSAGFISKDKDS